VVGFDDVLPAEVATPAMTTVRQPLRAMGLEAARRVLEEIAKAPRRQGSPVLHQTSPELVARMSTAAPPAERRTMKAAGRRRD
jgi:DNA-binding LacI/PurR family transcriptional regulator